jgi:hypothetical protein
MDKQSFLRYVDHFNNKRYEDVMNFYDPDVSIEYPTMLANPQAPPITRQGRAGFLEQYVTLHQHCREALEVGDFLFDANRNVQRVSLLQGLSEFLRSRDEGRRRLHRDELVHLYSRKREVQTHPRGPLPHARPTHGPSLTTGGRHKNGALIAPRLLPLPR